MQKYAMIPICFKYNEKDNMRVRRVLISYTSITKKVVSGYVVNIYEGTKFIEADQYFFDVKRSHQYKFTNEEYFLIYADNGLEEYYDLKPELFYKGRPYHTIEAVNLPQPIYLEAISDEEAIKTFNEREELR